jgi:hypothetical protein
MVRQNGPNAWNGCDLSVKNLMYFRLTSKNAKIKKHNCKFYLLLCMNVKTGDTDNGCEDYCIVGC